MEALIIWIIAGIMRLIECLKGADAPSWFAFWCVYAGLIVSHIGWIRERRWKK